MCNGLAALQDNGYLSTVSERSGKFCRRGQFPHTFVHVAFYHVPTTPCLNIRAWKFACGWVGNHLRDCFTTLQVPSRPMNGLTASAVSARIKSGLGCHYCTNKVSAVTAQYSFLLTCLDFSESTPHSIPCFNFQGTCNTTNRLCLCTDQMYWWARTSLLLDQYISRASVINISIIKVLLYFHSYSVSWDVHKHKKDYVI
jgi:hypothetical protein